MTSRTLRFGIVSSRWDGGAAMGGGGGGGTESHATDVTMPCDWADDDDEVDTVDGSGGGGGMVVSTHCLLFTFAVVERLTCVGISVVRFSR